MVSSICEKYGWKPKFVLNKIPWIVLQMMLADAAWYDYEADKANSTNTVTGSKSVTSFSIDSNTSQEDLRKFIDTINAKYMYNG